MKRYTAEEVLNLQSAAYQKGHNEGYQLRKLEHPSTPIWVKSTDRLPGWNLHVHWRIGNGPQTRWKTPVSEMIQSNYITNWEWLDEVNGQSNKEDAGDKKMLEFIRDCAENWDCDPDSHTYNLPCRKCEATKLYNEYQKQNNQ